MASANDIRKTFLDYFAKFQHEVIPSSPLVPHNDPTLLFTNAGMVQFKNVFTGSEKRPYKRAATSQKCVRAGGKHNDLDNVGYTARHHTFFEMLGNFSFGDYFKDVAIELAWKLLTQDYGLDPQRLLVTVYHDDDEAFGLWKKIAGLSDQRIIRISTNDNFWAMGDTGPCGPCSEIFFDHGPSVKGGPPGSAEEDGDRFIEIWNLVFMQYEQLGAGKRIDLPKPSIDTGMGLERISAVMQGLHDNYDVDLLKSIMDRSAELTGTPGNGEYKATHKVIADHLRSSAFLIADGVLPSNEGRGYVLRRIMRRAMRYIHTTGTKDPIMWRLVEVLVRKMGQAFPEISRAEPLIKETLKLEEHRFKETLDRGLFLLQQEVEKLGAGKALSGKFAFKLYDTYGFPLDLTEDILRSSGRTVHVQSFNEAMDKQRALARSSWVGSGESETEGVWYTLRQELGPTEFLGYETVRAEGQVVAIVVNGQAVESIKVGDEALVLVNQTPFYAESGGQSGDIGTIKSDGQLTFDVLDTQKRLGDLHIHKGTLVEGVMNVASRVELQVDEARRTALKANHSATHLLHEALRLRLGNHVTQKGSLVTAEKIRFDLSHPSPIEQSDLNLIQLEINQLIRENNLVETKIMTPEEAVKNGALALFGEKYGDEVRVVSIGNADNCAYSTELCGGTHVVRTGDIGMFKIIAETSVAAGVRRIEALTGQYALDYVTTEEHQLRAAASILKTSPDDVVDRLKGLVKEFKSLERQVSQLRKAAVTSKTADGTTTRDINGVSFVGKILSGIPAGELRSIVDAAKNEIGSGVVVFISRNEGKAALTVGVTKDLVGRFNAVDLVRVGAEAVGGRGGGGRPDMAQAGGPEGEQAEKALMAIEKQIERGQVVNNPA